jgi:hypothetical protein
MIVCLNFGVLIITCRHLEMFMFLENKYLKFQGLNLTLETLDGL